MELALAGLALLAGCGPKQGEVPVEPAPADPSPTIPEAAPSAPSPAEPAPVIPEAEPTEPGNLEIPALDHPCMPRAVYGPRPCSSDAECEDRNGAGWYCDKEHSFGDGCGGSNVWPVCARRE